MIDLSLEEARKLLGVSSEELPDNELTEEIETAKLFKDIFFEVLMSGNSFKQGK